MNKCYSDDELCDSNCKTCIFEAGIPISSNCATCNSNKYLNLGKCVDQCVNGYYTESSNKICKCDLIKCEKCSKESLNNNNLCITCNTNKGYYPKLNDENNYGDYINCYNGNIDGYYLDNYEYYKPCYSTCKTCNRYGNENIHYCNSCKSEYNTIVSKGSYYNCYICNGVYYLDDEINYYCLDTN